ncbi:MAG: hypothetical protein L6461_20525 [Anaerolineae bacterium]|nr:hypothetical protein [Anaerolineae bacterium]
MKAFFAQLLRVLAVGYLLLYFSEHVFWAQIRPDDSLANWISTWVAYSLAAFVFLTLISAFRVTSKWGLFLAAAVFGWLVEGVIVQTTYEQLPLSISFTGLAWHALISVMLGWYAIPKALLQNSPFATARIAGLTGLGYGLWAIYWWVEEGQASSIAEFATFSFLSTGVLIFAYWLNNLVSKHPFAPSRLAIGLNFLAFLLFFLFVTVPAAPVALLLLPVLLSLAIWGLWKTRQAPGQPFLESLTGTIRWWNYLLLLLLPLSAVAVYSLAWTLNLRLNTNWVLYIITTPLGFGLFGYSLYKAWRAKTTPL